MWRDTRGVNIDTAASVVSLRCKGPFNNVLGGEWMGQGGCVIQKYICHPLYEKQRKSICIIVFFFF